MPAGDGDPCDVVAPGAGVACDLADAVNRLCPRGTAVEPRSLVEVTEYESVALFFLRDLAEVVAGNLSYCGTPGLKTLVGQVGWQQPLVATLQQFLLRRLPRQNCRVD